jgi:hypothetical protein
LGRKADLTHLQMLAVGGECARMWRERAESAAMAEYHARAHLRDVRNIQEKLTSTPVADHQDARAASSADISEILSEVPIRPIQIKRPYGQRREVREAAVRWCAATYGITITPRRAQACWDEFAELEKRISV